MVLRFALLQFKTLVALRNDYVVFLIGDKNPL